MSLLEQLKTMSEVVADTGDFDSIKRFAPLDATTNPSLILEASKSGKYSSLIDDALMYAGSSVMESKSEQLKKGLSKLFVNFGIEILKTVPRRVSTEVDARLSFDCDGTVEHARELIRLYSTAGVDKERVLIKIAATWEGIRAAEILETEGIHCNLTLIFSLVQAIACAEAKVTLISPFVGRIYDWYKKDQNLEFISPRDDPGVKSVKDIYNYIRKFGYATQVMGASFRNMGQILELAGCDLLTISPIYLAELSRTEGGLDSKLSESAASQLDILKIDMDEKTFRWMLNEDIMATDKLSEGIRKFASDTVALEQSLFEKMC